MPFAGLESNGSSSPARGKDKKMPIPERPWESYNGEAQARDSRSESECSAGLAAQVAQCEKARELCGEIIATLELNFERDEMHPDWEPYIKRWKERLRKFGG